MKKLISPLITLLLFSVCNNACQQSKKQDKSNHDGRISNVGKKDNGVNDSLALLQLTTRLYKWEDTGSKSEDFVPLQKEKTDTAYVGIDFTQHKQRLQDLRNSNLFSEKFISNYNQIALNIDQELKSGTLVWNIGELPPFGNGASPWCNCQDVPDDFLNKIWIMHLSIKDNTAFYNWSWGDGIVYNIEAIKEGNEWKILYMEGFDYDSFIQSFQKNNDFTGRWQNDMVTLNIGETSLAFEYHGQCVYFYPVKKISDNEFEMIWARDMDCKFDNGTDKDFGLKEVPEIGKVFAKYSLKNNVLYAEYYYKDWVKKYTEQVQNNVFTPQYYKNVLK